MEYTVTLRANDSPDGWRTVRTTKAEDLDGAISLIEGFTELAISRNQVSWSGEMPDAMGMLDGTTSDGSLWQITVEPPFTLTEHTLTDDD